MYRNTGTKASGLKRKQRNDDGDEKQQLPPLPLHANRARAAASPVSRAAPITVLASLSAAAPYSLLTTSFPPSAPPSPTLSFSRPPSLLPYQLSDSPIPSAQPCLSMLIDPSPSPPLVSTTPPPPPVDAVQPEQIFGPPALPAPVPVAVPLPVVPVADNLTLAEVIALCSACSSHNEYLAIRPMGFMRLKATWKKFDGRLRKRKSTHGGSWDAVLLHVCTNKRIR
jgi:hypothetical protein